MKPYCILNNVIFLHIENNYTDSENHKSIEISAIKIKDKVVTKFDTALNPVRSDLLIFFENLPLVSHNTTFEEGFLKVDNELLNSLELLSYFFLNFRRLIFNI